MEQVTFLIFAYEPFEKIRVPALLDSVEEAMEFVKRLTVRRELHYIDIYLITEENELFSAHLDNQINFGEINRVFEGFRKKVEGA